MQNVMKVISTYFRNSLILTVIGLILGGFVGWEYSGTISGALSAVFITFVLAMLEVSLSFDNAVVNATVLEKMNEKWRHRFMTWGIVIAVFGMRIVFPVAVVSIIAWISPWDALVLALTKPDQYAKVMTSSHAAIGGFGASFLLCVALRYFFDPEKDVHWFGWLERPLAWAGRLALADIVVCTAVFGITALFLSHDVKPFLIAAAVGIGSFLALHVALRFLHVPDAKDIEKASITMFLYLEVIDASFSLDGVIGAFAITHNLLIIAIGLGIGALFVRSMTLMLVDKQTLTEFRYLEHGAFYAIASLAAVMIADMFVSVPEVVAGLLGVVIISISLLSSVRHNRSEAR